MTRRKIPPLRLLCPDHDPWPTFLGKSSGLDDRLTDPLSATTKGANLKILKALAAAFFYPVSLAAWALDYPAQLQGSYAYSKGNVQEACQAPAIVIEKQVRYNDVDAGCRLLKLTVTGNKFSMDEACGREDSKWSQKTVMELSPTTLSISQNSRYQGKSVGTYVRCPAAAAKQADAAPQGEQKALTCKVNPGQAGVTTYLDDKLKKTGSSIRDFDDYVFKADAKIKVNKRDILVGKLLNSDGSVAEARSFVDVQEWACR